MGGKHRRRAHNRVPRTPSPVPCPYMHTESLHAFRNRSHHGGCGGGGVALQSASRSTPAPLPVPNAVGEACPPLGSSSSASALVHPPAPLPECHGSPPSALRSPGQADQGRVCQPAEESGRCTTWGRCVRPQDRACTAPCTPRPRCHSQVGPASPATLERPDPGTSHRSECSGAPPADLTPLPWVPAHLWEELRLV